MSIEINGQSNPSRLNTNEGSSTQSTPGESGGKAQNTAALTSPDTLSLTNTAAIMQEIQARIASTPVVDGARVEAIKEALNNGTYLINTDSVAEKLMSFEANLNASI